MRVVTNWKTTISASLTATQTTIPVSSIQTTDDTPHTITIADFTDGYGYMTIEPSGTKIELIKFTGITDNGDGSGTLTGVTRGLAFYSGSDAGVAANGQTHQAGSSIVCSNSHYYYDRLMDLVSDETAGGVKTFTSSPIVPTPTTATQAANKSYVDGVAVAGAPDASTTVKGIVEEATQAEVDARTAAGGTSARLIVNPSTLRSTLKSDYVAAAGTVNAITITPSPAITAYAAGQEFVFKASKTNTGAVTLAVNGLAATPVKRNKNYALVGAEITTNLVVGVRFDGTNFQLEETASPKVSVDGRELYGVSATGTTVFVVGLSLAQTQLVAGFRMSFKSDTASSGGATLNVNGLGAKTIKAGGVALINSDIPANQVVEVIYDGTDFQLQNIQSSTRKIRNNASGVTVASTTTETNLLNVSIPGGVLSTNNAVRVTIPVSEFSLSNTKVATFRLKYGVTTLVSTGFTLTGSAQPLVSNAPGKIEVLLLGAGATNSQSGVIMGMFGTGSTIGSATDVFIPFLTASGTSAIDSTTAQALVVSVEFNAATSGDRIITLGSVVERIG